MEEQVHRPAIIKKITVEKKPLQVHAGAPGKGLATSPEAPAVMVTTPKAHSKHMLESPRACLCSPTTHAGSFRCRLHRGGFGGSGSGLHEMGKKPGV